MSKPYPCVYCTEDGYCKKYSDERVISWCVQGPCKDEKPSNADRIRAMTDEEMAEWITELTDCAVYPYTRKDDPCISIGQTCAASWLCWLKQEAQCTSG